MLLSNTFLLTALFILLGSAISTTAGFGFGIVTIPFLLMLYPPKTAVALLLVVAAFGMAAQWFRLRRWANYRLVVRLAAGAVFGIPLGGVVISVIDPALLKALIGVSVLTGALMVLVRGESDLSPRQPSLPFTLTAGFGAGLLATTVGQPGLAAASFMAWTRWDKAEVRATLYSFALLSNFGSLATLYAEGTLTSEIGRMGITLVPLYLVGMMAGDQGFRRLTQASHRKLTMVVLVVSAILGIYNGVTALIG